MDKLKQMRVIQLLKNRFADIKYFFWLLKNFNKLKKNNYSLMLFLKYWILYAISRLTLDKEKAHDISKNIISHFKDKNLIIPLPMNSPDTYWMGLRDSGDFEVFREVCMEDHYNYSQIKKDMVVVDVGAHIGTFTLLASKKAGEKGKVIAIEPEPQNFNQLIKNLKINEIKNVITIKTALNDFNGQADFFITDDSMSHSFFPQASNIREKTQIEVKTLDALLQELRINKVDLLKIDAENAELKILKGAKETLIINPQMKMVIAAYHSLNDPLEIIRYLKELNFSPKILPGIFTLVLVE